MADDDRRRGPRRVDARRNREALIRAAAGLLRAEQPMSMRAVADAAGVSRSTLYRHFRDPDQLRAALEQEAVAAARAAIERSRERSRTPLAQLRGVITGLVGVGAELPPTAPVDDLAAALRPLAERIATAAALDPAPDAAWLEDATAHLLEACLGAGWNATGELEVTVERLIRAVTEPLDRGLVLLDADGRVVALNEDGRLALGGSDPIQVGDPAVIREPGVYEDGSPAPAESHPLTLAIASGEPEDGLRGHASAVGGIHWSAIEVLPMRRPSTGNLYGFVAIFSDVSDEKRFELSHLRPPGELAATAAPLLDLVRILDEVPPPLLPEQLVAEATRLAGGPAALYVLDIDGSHLLRLAGREDFPARLRAPLAVGPELAPDGLPDLAAQLAAELPGAVMAPMWLRDRAIGVLLALRGAESSLREVSRLGAAALELAGGYTDVIDAARRRKHMNPAAEIQQSLLPPRIARIGRGELAGSVLPSYDVGGDWFDYVENRDGAWIAIADAAGKGPRAGGLGSIGLAALRAARRNEATLEEAVQTMHETLCDAGDPEFFLTAIVARWSSVYSVFSWINCGHPPPLLIRADGAVTELATAPDLPLGVFERTRAYRRHQRRLADGDRLVLYSDGISGRKTEDGLFGTSGIAAAAAAAPAHSAAATVQAIQGAVAGASEDPLPDDAAVIVLAASA